MCPVEQLVWQMVGSACGASAQAQLAHHTCCWKQSPADAHAISLICCRGMQAESGIMLHMLVSTAALLHMWLLVIIAAET